MAKPAKRRVQGGRTTSKGPSTRPAKQPASTAREPAGRYTAPIPKQVKVSPMWVPILMFAFLGIGTLMILVNYTGAVWSTNNWVLLGGLALILAGIVTATQYH